MKVKFQLRITYVGCGISYVGLTKSTLELRIAHVGITNSYLSKTY